MIVRLLKTRTVTNNSLVYVLGGTTGETTGKTAIHIGLVIEVKWDSGLKLAEGRLEDLYSVMDMVKPEELEIAE